MKRLVILILLGLGGCVTAPDINPLSLANRTASQPVVENALSAAMPALHASARAGKANDQLAFGLALLAGRDNRGAVTEASRVVVESKLTADAAIVYAAHPVMADAPTSADAVAWARQVTADLDACVPCSVDAAVVVPWDDAQQPMLSEYAEATSARYWLAKALGAQTGQRTTAIYVPPVRLGGAGSTMLLNIPSQPLIDPTQYLSARYCVEGVALSLKADAAEAWLRDDLVKATGQRQVLDNALTDALARLDNDDLAQYCADGSFDHLRELLVADRPDLSVQVAGFLAQRLADPHQPAS